MTTSSMQLLSFLSKQVALKVLSFQYRQDFFVNFVFLEILKKKNLILISIFQLINDNNPSQSFHLNTVFHDPNID